MSEKPNPFSYHWKELVSLCAGITLVSILSVSVDEMSVFEGWFVYLGGALISTMAAGAMASDKAWLSWTTAAFGVVPLPALLFTGTEVPILTTGLVAACGMSVVVLSVWSALERAKPARQPALKPRAQRVPAE